MSPGKACEKKRTRLPRSPCQKPYAEALSNLRSFIRGGRKKKTCDKTLRKSYKDVCLPLASDARAFDFY